MRENMLLEAFVIQTILNLNMLLVLKGYSKV
jgi:hypothetical protein